MSDPVLDRFNNALAKWVSAGRPSSGKLWWDAVSAAKELADEEPSFLESLPPGLLVAFGVLEKEQ